MESKSVEINDLISREDEYQVKLETLERSLEEAESNLTNQLQGNKDVSATLKDKVSYGCRTVTDLLWRR